MMTHLKKLCSLEGVSGREHPVREYILRVLQQSPADMSVRVDPMGNVLAHVKGRERAKHTLLFAAHMDEVGFMITGVTPEGYLRFTTVGGIDPKVVYGRSVRVGGISGVIGGKATHLCSADEKKQVPKPSELLIDIGAASKEEAEALADEIPAGREGTKEEAAQMICMVADAPDYLTGQIITMDGGWI